MFLLAVVFFGLDWRAFSARTITESEANAPMRITAATMFYAVAGVMHGSPRGMMLVAASLTAIWGIWAWWTRRRAESEAT